MKIIVILLLALVCTTTSCKSGDASSSTSSSQATAKCICGTPEADFSGCPNAHCIKGERNPDNPDCVCGPMKIGGK
jgi:hypothetical protein